MKPSKIQVVALAAAVLTIVLITCLLYATRPISQSARAVLTGPELASYWSNQVHAAAKATSSTEGEAANFWKRLLGSPVMWDRKGNLMVSYDANPDGSAESVHIGGMLGPFIGYKLPDSKDAGVVTYSGKWAGGSDPHPSTTWEDLNSDGVFDRLMIMENHNELLNLDRGVYILLNGNWTRAEPSQNMPKMTYKVGAATYHFDSTSGRWVTQ